MLFIVHYYVFFCGQIILHYISTDTFLPCTREKLNSMNLLLYMAPIAVVFLLPATLMMEENVVGITLALARDDVKIIWYLLFNSALAYLVNLTNFLVTKHTSALTLQVCLTYSYRHTSLFFFANFNILLNERMCCHTQVYYQNVY